MPRPPARMVAFGLLLLCGGLTAAHLWWQSRPAPAGPLRVGCTDCPPYGAGGDLAAKVNPMTGFASEVVDEAARRAGLRIEWTPVENGATALLDNQADLWPRLAPGDGLGKRVYFSQPWLNMNYCLVSRRGTSVGGASALRVAHVDRPFLHGLLRRHVPNAASVPVPSSGGLLDSVCLGQADAAFLETRVVYALLVERRTGCADTRLQVAPLPQASIPSSVAARPEAAWAADLLRDEIGRMSEDGALAAIHARWFLITSSETSAIDNLLQARRDLVAYQLLALVFMLFLIVLLFQHRRLGAARRAAARASQLKSQFVTHVSHELRTPLAGVIGVADLLAAGPLLSRQGELVRLIRSSAQSLLHVVNDILDLAKVESGKLDIASEPFRPRDVVAEAAALMSPRAQARQVSVEADIAPEVPAWVRGDAVRLGQVLINLLGNGVKFTTRGSVRVTIDVDSRDAFQWHLRFSVIDTGPGIPASEMSTLFEEFGQGRAAHGSDVPGTGLGLPIARRLVELMGGRLQVESEEGRGTTFWFTLPLDVASADRPADGDGPLPDSPRRLRVLVCEDSMVNQRVALELLSRLHHHADAVELGQAAVDRVAQEEYDLVLMDCHLPDMTGQEATRRIRSQEGARAHVPVVALTASSPQQEEQRCREAGMDGFLAKPIDLASLARAIEQYTALATIANDRNSINLNPINKVY